MRYLGWASLCLPASDLELSKRFYLGAGMRLVSEMPGKRVILESGNFRLALMPFLDAPLVNFRGGDVPAAYASVSEKLPTAEGAPEQYTKSQYDADADGICWITKDPDGTAVLFDTHELEQGDEYRASRTLEVLEGAADTLEQMGADVRTLENLRSHVIEPFRKSRQVSADSFANEDIGNP